VLVCVLKGAIFFLADLARRLDFDLELRVHGRLQLRARSTETSGVVRILKDLDTDIEGRHILIVEDIIDSGLTLQYLTRSLWSRNPPASRSSRCSAKPSRRTAELPLQIHRIRDRERVCGGVWARPC